MPQAAVITKSEQASLARAIRSIGIREVSRQSGVNPSCLSQFARGMAGLSHPSMIRVAKVCGFKYRPVRVWKGV